MLYLIIALLVLMVLNFVVQLLVLASLAKVGNLTTTMANAVSEMQGTQELNMQAIAMIQSQLSQMSVMVDSIGGLMGLRKVEKQNSALKDVGG